MKIVHLSDLHLGIRLNEFSLMDDQQYVLKEILSVIDLVEPDCVIIAGDVYDKAVPSAEAVRTFDEFLFSLATRKLKVFVGVGNHDSAERTAFGSRLMGESGVYISPVYKGNISPVETEDERGKVYFYLLPFIRPAAVRELFPDEDVLSASRAVELAVERMNIDRSARNVLVAHQYVVPSSSEESERDVGGLEEVDAGIFSGFDYVALGHIHSPKNVKPHIRYCGSPLKYSRSEIPDEKSVTVVELGEKGEVNVSLIPLKPMREMREIRGEYNDLVLRENYEGTSTGDYIFVTLTDEDDVFDALNKLRVIYPNIMELSYDNTRTRALSADFDPGAESEKKTETELLDELFEIQNGRMMTDEEKQIAREIFTSLKEGGE